MKQASTFFGWNGTGEVTWTIDEGNDYPRLAWEGKPGTAFGPYGLTELLSGTGSKTDPYLISTGGQLNWAGVFPFEWGKHFTLTADVDLSAFTGNQFNLLGIGSMPFWGTFEGAGHTIYNFTFHSADSGYVGLFACILHDETRIQNLCVRNADVSGHDYVGILVGWNSGTISNCSAQGIVHGEGTVGGLVGFNSFGVISGCSTTVGVSGQGAIGRISRNQRQRHHKLLFDRYRIGCFRNWRVGWG